MISVVVIGRNEGDRLIRCLESVKATSYPTEKIELIYVDSNSTDNSVSSAGDLGARVLESKAEPSTAAAARNLGFREAQYEIVQFLDGDTVLDGDWLRKGVEAIADASYACVFGSVMELEPQATIYNFWAHHDWHVTPGPAESCGGIAMFRRDVLGKAGGFDETLRAGEEPDLCHRITRDQGKSILCLDEPMVAHDIGMTRFSQYWARCARTGHAYAEVGGRNKGMHRWRSARWRNVAHAAAGPIAVVLSLGLRSWWPVAVWVGLLMIAIVRNALRLRGRVGSLRGALLYSFHHYLAKLPMAVGQFKYWLGLQ